MNALVDYGSDSSSDASRPASPEIKKTSNPDVPVINASQKSIHAQAENSQNDEMVDATDDSNKKDWRQHYSDSEDVEKSNGNEIDQNTNNGVDYSNFERITEFDDAV